MNEFWYATWADKKNAPDQTLLDKWTLERWIEKKAIDFQTVIIHLNAALGVAPEEELLRAALSIEKRAYEHLIMRSPILVPAAPVDVVPARVNEMWVGKRLQELQRQRWTFSTFAYWKKPPPDKRAANIMAQLLTGPIRQYENLGAKDWTDSRKALQQYVDELERIQLMLAIGHNRGIKPLFGKLGKRLRAKMTLLHKHLADDNEERDLGLTLQPWNVDMGAFFLTWEEWEAGNIFANWSEGENKPVPILTDGPLIKEVMEMDLEDFISKRRDEIDLHLIEWRARRFYLVKGYLRRERKIWGEAIKAIAQLKRWDSL